MSSADKRPLVIGVGSANRSDDGVGAYVSEGLKARGFDAIAHEGDGAALLDLWEAKSACILVDAMSGGGEPGTIRVFRDFAAPVFAHASFVRSTHQVGLAEAVSLARALGRLPADLMVIGVAGVEFGYGRRLSPPVASAADRLIDRLSDTADWRALFTNSDPDQIFT